MTSKDLTTERYWRSRIANVRLFMEPPPHLSPDANYFTTGLPKGFIESADRELELDGELVSSIKARRVLEIERIPPLQDSERQAFFSSQAKSPLWDVYYGSGWSGARYSVLIEYNIQPGIHSDTTRSRRSIYLEWEEYFDKAVMEYIVENDKATSEEITNRAIEAASHKTMVKHGISRQEMGGIIAEGTAKWSKWSGLQQKQNPSDGPKER